LLAQRGIPVEGRDLFGNPLTEDELRALVQRGGLESIFSWRSPTARARGLAPGTLDEAEAIRLMAAEPRLIRRPLIDSGDRLIVGADAAAIGALDRPV
jgi:arsenate reductase-like glutaredoxin family protein